ncbi:MAG TPA: YXWGXW repeat-containing protein [Verrucomicrobiae bacterium]|jgi:hypothetical protein
MSKKHAKIAKWALIVSSSCLLAAGCAVEATGPVPAGGGEVYVNSELPPPPEVDYQTPTPGPDYVWIGGEWGWEGRRWAWHGGHWDRPPHAGVHWAPGRYEVRGSRRVYHRGGWR